MALRNAFAEIATEFTLRKLIEQTRFARDAADRLRVVIDSSATIPASVYTNNANANISTVTPFGGSAWNANDARHEMQEASLQSFQMTRNRWSIT